MNMKYYTMFFLTSIFNPAASYATWNSPVIFNPESGKSYYNQELHLYNDQRIDNLQLSGSSMLTLNSGSLLRHARINDTARIHLYNTENPLFSAPGIEDVHFSDRSILMMESGSFSAGRLSIESGASLYITHVDDDSYSPFPAPPLVSGNVAIEHLDLAGKVVIAPTSTLEDIPDGEDSPYQNQKQPPGPSVITRIGDLSMQPGSRISMESYLPSMQFNELKINSLSGSGDFILSTHLARGFSDKIEIEQATGQFGLLVNDSGYEPDTPQRTGVVSVKRGSPVFTLRNPEGVVEAGIWQYRLQHEKSDSQTEWFLTSNILPNEQPDSQPAQESYPADAAIGVARSTSEERATAQTEASRSLAPAPARLMSRSAQAAINMAGVSRYIMSAEMSTLHQRLGDMRQINRDLSLWGRYLSDERRQESPYGPSSRTQLHGLQIGLDHRREHNNGSWLSGAYLSDTDARVSSGHRANGQSKSQSGAIYTAWLSTTGFYWDNQLKLSTFRHHLHTKMNGGNTTTGHYHQRGLSFASETGYTRPLSAKTALTPYGKISYFRTGKARYAQDNGMISVLPLANSVEAEAGLLLQTTLSMKSPSLSPYVRAAVSAGLHNHSRIVINDTPFSQPSAGTRERFGVGTTLHIAKEVSASAEIEQQTGRKSRSPARAHLGIRVGF